MAYIPRVEAGTAKASTTAFRALAETTPDAIVVADLGNRITYVNEAAAKLSGYPREDLVGRPVTILVPEHLRDAHLAGFEHFVRTREPRLVGSTVAVELRRADGERVPVELSLGFTGDGPDASFTALIRDASEALRSQRLAAAQIAVTSVLVEPEHGDVQHRIVAALTAALGWDVGALWLVEGDRLRLADIWQADPRETTAFAQACGEATFGLGTGAPGYAWETVEPVWMQDVRTTPRFLRRDAAKASRLITGVSLPVRTEGTVVGVLELFSRRHEPLDAPLRHMFATVTSQIAESLRRRERATELATRNQELARSNQDLEHFAHVVAHDLAEPMRTISGFAELLATGRHQASQDEFLQAIQTSARRGQDILDALLNLARLGSSELQLAEADLGLVASDVLVGLHAMIDSTGARIDVEPLPVVRGDPALLGQVLQNLLANAMKFRSGEAPVVHVAAQRLADAWRVEVRDNGRGIPEGADVFGMFQRVGGHNEVGLGIGLAACQKIVERHGGRIWFEPAPEGGTTFAFTLPTDAAA